MSWLSPLREWGSLTMAFKMEVFPLLYDYQMNV